MTAEPATPSRPDDRAGSAYASGGGGVVLEHTFGATLLAALLLGDPAPGLGDEQSVVSVAFQAGHSSPVDDVLVTGEALGGDGRRRLAIAVRRKPSIAAGDKEFVALLGKYLRQIENEWKEIQSGRLRLGLAVSAPYKGAGELARLASFAQAQRSNEDFRRAVSAPGATTKAIRRRLVLLDQAVVAAGAGIKTASDDDPNSELTWRLLSGLRVIETRLESPDTADSTATVIRLRSCVGEAAEADRLFTELCRLVSRYEPLGAVVDNAMLRRDLAGVVNVGRSPSLRKAWEALEVLEQRLRQNTRRKLISTTGEETALERTVARDALLAAMRDASSRGVGLVVTGEPDIGKSALALSAADVLTAQGEEVISISLRDLPPSALDALHYFGAPMNAVFGSMAASPMRLFVVDGAEAAQEDRFGVLVDLGASARAAGVGLVAITRSDARGRVVEALAASTPDGGPPAEIEIAGLTTDEVEQVVGAYPVLARLATEPRMAWLLDRPGLIDVLLRADAVASLPVGALSEADVFAAVWDRLVRRRPDDPSARGGSPDGRELALVALARRQLVPDASSPTADSGALPSLRSDGLLLAPGPTSAWSPGDRFATDLVRDFALARLFVRDGWSALTAGGAPRFAIRAARLACQVHLAASTGTLEDTRVDLQRTFDLLASEHGDRWADLPLEAIVTLGSPHDALQQAWPALLGNDHAGLRRLLRLILQRYVDGLAADPMVAEPVVQLLLDRDESADLPRDIRESIGELEIRWLRGLAERGAKDTPNTLRADLRDRILASRPGRHDEHDQECLALLGPDLNPEVEEHLRNLAREAPGFLAPCVESFSATQSMSIHRRDLLLDLAAAYYIEIEVDDPDGWGLRHSIRDNGVREHHRKGGYGVPMVAWYYGPFWQLLRTGGWASISFINRLLDHAARARLRLLRDIDAPLGAGRIVIDDDLPRLELDVPGVGRRQFVGDSDAWSWYRGSSVGPYPCISALLAVERFADQVHALGVDLRTLVARLLKDCQNLAMPGMVFGFLVRHLEQVTNELDPWLAEPLVWELDFRRASAEGRFHVQGSDPNELHGLSARKLLPSEVAVQLAIRAIVADDRDAVSRLASVADTLVERASVRYGPDSTAGYEERMSNARAWASLLRTESYSSETRSDGTVLFQHTPPEVTEEVATRQAEFDRGAQILRLFNYGTNPTRQPADLTRLHADLRDAMQLFAQPPGLGQQFAPDAFPAIAATAIVAYVEGRFESERAPLEWAATVVIQAAMSTPDARLFEPSFFSMGADRSAALSVPCLLLPPFSDDASWLDDDDIRMIHNAILKLMTSGSDEVRRLTARALDRIWNAPCSPRGRNVGRCRHRLALDAVEASVRDCRIGPFDYELQRKQILPLESLEADQLDAIEPENLLTVRLTAPLYAVSMCTLSGSCVSAGVVPLRNALLRLHARGAAYWVGQAYHLDQDPEVQQLVAETLLRLGAAGELEAVQTYVNTLLDEPLAFSHLLQEFARSATYDPVFRKAVRDMWVTLATRSMTLLEERRRTARASGDRGYKQRDWDDAIAALIPNPQLRLSDLDASSTLANVRSNWIDLELTEPLIPRWMTSAVGKPKCVDSLVGYVRTLPIETQARRGLDLVAEVVDDQFDKVASHTWSLVEWLKEVKGYRSLQGAQMSKFQLLVDGLAAHGDIGAARLQQSLE